MDGGHSNILGTSKFFNVCKYPFYELKKSQNSNCARFVYYTLLCREGFSPLNNISSFKLLDAGCFCFRRLMVLSSKRSIPLEILLVNNFKTPFTFPFPIKKANFLDNPPMFFIMLIRCKRN